MGWNKILDIFGKEIEKGAAIFDRETNNLIKNLEDKIKETAQFTTLKTVFDSHINNNNYAIENDDRNFVISIESEDEDFSKTCFFYSKKKKNFLRYQNIHFKNKPSDSIKIKTNLLKEILKEYMALENSPKKDFYSNVINDLPTALEGYKNKIIEDGSKIGISSNL